MFDWASVYFEHAHVTQFVMDEQSVGIERYLSEGLVGFTGVIKARYTDFLVNEIDLEGTVVHVTDLGDALTEPKVCKVALLSTEKAEKVEKEKEVLCSETTDQFSALVRNTYAQDATLDLDDFIRRTIEILQRQFVQPDTGDRVTFPVSDLRTSGGSYQGCL